MRWMHLFLFRKNKNYFISATKIPFYLQFFQKKEPPSPKALNL